MKIIWILFIMATIGYGYVGWDGESHVEFNSILNEHGIVLRSTGYIYDIKGYGYNTEYVNRRFVSKDKGGITLYLGKECDAYSKRYGKGEWRWANGGFVVNFDQDGFAFGRQELGMDHISDMNMSKCAM